MKFYGYGIVWDASNDMPLCEFKDGLLDTDDERVIGVLTGLGYESDGVKEEPKKKTPKSRGAE